MVRNRKTLILVGALLIVASLALAAFMLQPSAADLLTQSAEAMQLATDGLTDGHAVFEFSVDTPEQSGTGTIEVWGMLNAGPNGEPAFRAEVLSSTLGEAAGMIAVSDGSQFWLWNPAENKVLTATADEIVAYMEQKAAEGDFAEFEGYNHEEGTDPAADHPQTPEEAVQKLLEYFTAERLGTEKLGETNAYKLRLIPIPEQMPDEVRAAGGLLNVWIRPDDNLPLGVEYTGGALGEGRAVATLLELNPGVDAALFTFDIPAGAEITHLADLEPQSMAPEEAAAAAGFALLTPAELPADAKLVDTLEMRGAVVQRYTTRDGGSFTLAQGPAGAAPLPDGEGQQVDVRGTTGLLFSDEAGGRTLLTWTEGEVTFWIGGDLTADQALALANALQ